MGHLGRPLVTLFAIAAVAGLASSCTSSESGSPTAAPGATSAPSVPPGTESTVPGLPTPSAPTSGSPIPNPVDLSKVDACKLFTSGVSAAAETKGEITKLEVPRLPGASGCTQFGEDKNVGLVIAASSDTDLSAYSQTVSGAQPQQFTVAGYPAVIIKPTAPDVVCFGGVGMGDHQLLYLQYSVMNPTSSPRLPQDQLCAKLRPIAQQVVAGLTG